MRTLQDFFPLMAALRSREAIRWTNGFRTSMSTYEDLLGTTGAAAAYFEGLGMRKGDRILLWSENSADWVAVFWACIARGIEIVPVDFRFSKELMLRIEGESNPKIIVDRGVLETIAALPKIVGVQV